MRAAKRSWRPRDSAGAARPFVLEDWEEVRRSVNGDPRFFVFASDAGRTVFTPRWRLLAIDRADPRLAEGYRVAVRALAAMAAEAERRGTAFAVLVIPTKELVFRPWVPLGSDADYDRLTALEDELLAELRGDLASRDIAVVEALPALRAAVREGRQPYPASADGHKNPAGHRAVAAATLRELGRLFPGGLDAC